ncbi:MULTISPECIES: hypothetical protein [unclassified Streptomyces]|uniref:hypothetical protein n=1 Tax=unclassified Streptomyces TaxID=2593676 RepID=UPI003668443D
MTRGRSPARIVRGTARRTRRLARRAPSVLPALWRRATGQGGGGRATAAFLRRRMVVLPALAVVALALCAAAYSDVHGRSERLRDRCVPALVGLAQTRTSLQLAQQQAELRLLKGPQVELVELGETYRSRLTEASQSLHRVAASGALSKGQEQELRVVSGLVVAYDDKIAWAERNRTSDVLRTAGIEYADDMLGKPTAGRHPQPTTVLDRIAELEWQLRRESGELAAWSPLTLAAAAAAALVTGLFAFVAAGTSVFLRDRLRLVSLQLSAACVPVLLTPVLLAAGGAEEHAAQQHVRAEVVGLTGIPVGVTAPREIEGAAADAADAMRAAHPDGWALTAGVAVPAGILGALACGVTLYLYGRPYPAARLPRRKDADADV